MSRNIVIGGNQVSKKDERRDALLRFIRRRSGRQRHYAVLQHGASDYRRHYRRQTDDIIRCEDRGRSNFQNGAGRVEIG